MIFADHQHIETMRLKYMPVRGESRKAFGQTNARHACLWIADDARSIRAERFAHHGSKAGEGGWCHGEELVARSNFFSVPSKNADYALRDHVGRHPMWNVVKSPHHQSVIGDECQLRRENRISLGLEHGKRIAMTVEGRLMGDNEIVSFRGGALQHVERCHHRDGNAANRRARIAGLECVNRGIGNRYVGVLDDSGNYARSSDGARLSDDNAQRDDDD